MLVPAVGEGCRTATALLLTSTRRISLYRKIVIKPHEITHDFYKHLRWVQPEMLRPWHPQRSCDLRPLDKVDPTWLRLEYRPFADVLEKLPEEHKKLFTVQYGHRKDGIAIIKEETVSLVRRHVYDQGSPEFKVARYTVMIRDYQVKFATDRAVMFCGRDRKKCKELIDKRKKWLRRIRERDYKLFEWIIELLGIIYKPVAPRVKIERNASINALVNMFCNELREKKMNEYKAHLETEKVPFLEMKLETLKQIKEEEESINVVCSVDEEIEDTKKLLVKLRTPVTVHAVEDASTIKELPAT